MRGSCAGFPQLYAMNSTPRASFLRNTDASPPPTTSRLKEPFIDTPTNYTKSSTGVDVESLEQTITTLRKQNEELRATIISLRANEFYEVSSERVRSLIQQNQQHRHQIKQLKAQVDKLKIQKDFLVRNNSNLKQQCSELMRKISELSLGQPRHKNRQPATRQQVECLDDGEYTNITKYLRAASEQRAVTSRLNKVKLNSKIQSVNGYERTRVIHQSRALKSPSKASQQYYLFKSNQNFREK